MGRRKRSRMNDHMKRQIEGTELEAEAAEQHGRRGCGRAADGGEGAPGSFGQRRLRAGEGQGAAARVRRIAAAVREKRAQG